jgi:hypothetical protein
MGNAITSTQKYAMANEEASKTLKELLKINAETPHTLEQTVKIYDAMYISMKKAGASTADMIEITKKLSIAAGTKIGFDALLSAVDGLSSGTVEVASDMGRFLSSIGLTNQALKETSDVVQLVKDKLDGFKSIDSLDTKISNLSNSWSLFAAQLMETPFDMVEGNLNSITGVIEQMRRGLTNVTVEFKNVEDLTEKSQMLLKYTQLLKEKSDISNNKFMWDSEQQEAIDKIDNQLLSLSKKISEIKSQSKTKGSLVDAFDGSEINKLVDNTLNPYGKKIDEINNKWSKHFDYLTKNGKDTTELTKAWTKEIADLDESYSKKKNDTLKTTTDNTKTSLEETKQAYADIAKVGLADYQLQLTSIIEKTQEWIKSGVSENEVLAAKKILLDELNNAMSSEKLQEELSYYERKIQLMDNEYEKQVELNNIKYAQSVLEIEGSNRPIEEKQALIDKETELFKLTQERLELENNNEFQETLLQFQDDALQRQLDLNEAMYDFGDSFEGIPGQIANVSKSIVAMTKISLKSKKQEIDLNKKYEKAFTDVAGNVEKTKALEIQYTKDSAELKTQSNDAEMAGYANLAGAMASAFENGSTAAIAFTTLQATLGIASSWTAIAMAWASAPFPANLPAVAAASAGVLPIIANLASMGGSGGSSRGGGSSRPTYTEIKKKRIENQYTPMTDRLDRQIELLESIDKQGSASALGLQGSGVSFLRDYALASNEILSKMRGATKSTSLLARKNYASLSEELGFSVIRNVGSGTIRDRKSLEEDFNLASLISKYFETGDKYIEKLFGKDEVRLNLAANKIQEAIGDYTKGVIDSLDDMKDASKDFKSSYDEITGSMYYENKRLAEAFNDVSKLVGSSTIEDYLRSTITNIDDMQKIFTDTVMEILLSQDPKDLAKQIEVLKDLELQTGLTFENGVTDALDYMESIQLVGEAMASSRENIKSYEDSFKSDDVLASEMAKTLGVTVATTSKGLTSLFETLKEGIDGLNDSELEFLLLNKELLEAKTEEAKALQDERTSLIDSITNYVKELRGSSSTLTIGTTFKTFASSFNSMIGAIKSGSSSLSEIGQTTLDNAKSYLDTVALTATSGRDLQFAKQVVANKLASVTNAPDITLGTVNETLKISFNENSVIVNELKAMREQLSYLNGLNTTQTATQLKTLSATRALIS